MGFKLRERTKVCKYCQCYFKSNATTMGMAVCSTCYKKNKKIADIKRHTTLMNTLKTKRERLKGGDEWKKHKTI
jgi:protein-arginine kinase activator protein McsA